MQIEPAHAPDGSIDGWLLYRGERYVGSICKTNRRRWQWNDADGAVKGIFNTRRAAFDAASLTPAKET